MLRIVKGTDNLVAARVKADGALKAGQVVYISGEDDGFLQVKVSASYTAGASVAAHAFCVVELPHYSHVDQTDVVANDAECGLLRLSGSLMETDQIHSTVKALDEGSLLGINAEAGTWYPLATSDGLVIRVGDGEGSEDWEDLKLVSDVAKGVLVAVHGDNAIIQGL